MTIHRIGSFIFLFPGSWRKRPAALVYSDRSAQPVKVSPFGWLCSTPCPSA